MTTRIIVCPRVMALPIAASASAANRRLASTAALRASTRATHSLVERARRLRQLGDLGHRAGDIALLGPHFDAPHDRRRIVAGRLVDRPDAHDLFRVGLQPVEDAALARCGPDRLGERTASAP